MLHAEQEDEQEDTNQLRAGPVRHVRLGAGAGTRGREGDGEGVEGNLFAILATESEVHQGFTRRV